MEDAARSELSMLASMLVRALLGRADKRTERALSEPVVVVAMLAQLQVVTADGCS